MYNLVKGRLSIVLLIGSSIALLEFIGWMLSNSVALLSDATHMLTDIIALLLSLVAARIALMKHTTKLTYGYHRAEVLAALANGILLLVLVAFILSEAYDRFVKQEIIDSILLLIIASIGLIANLSMLLIMRRMKDMINIRSIILHIFSDTLSSISVIVGGFIIHLTGLFIIDPLIAIGISALISRYAIILIKDVIHILLEGVPKEVSIDDIVDAIKSVDGVIDIHDLHVWCITTDLLALSAHLVIKDQMVSESIKIIEEVKSRMVKFGITHTTIQLESERIIDRIDSNDNSVR